MIFFLKKKYVKKNLCKDGTPPEVCLKKKTDLMVVGFIKSTYGFEWSHGE